MVVRTKICGLCRAEDAAVAAAAGADYFGVVLAPGGRRSQSVREAAEILASVPSAARVGVFVDAEPDELVRVARALELGVVQLHGAEPPAAVERVRGEGAWRVWKAVRVRDGAAFTAGVEAYGHGVDGLLLDGWSPSAPGGTGVRFPWGDVAGLRAAVPDGVTLVVAGGLTPDNVAAAVERLAPDVVDVSSGVEAAVGRKHADRVRVFVQRARGAVHGRA